MGVVAVLHPQDVLKDRLNYNHLPLISNSNPKSISNSNRRRKSPQKKPNDLSRSPPLKSSNLVHNFNSRNGLPRSPPKGEVNPPNLVMGKVKILKRGEALTNKENTKKVSFEKEKIDFDVKSIELVLRRLGPEPEMVPKQIHLADFYAGSAFVASPPPSSVPVPCFFKKSTPGGDSDLKNDEYASSDLRRLLKLEF